jgi:hypothetical protein
LTRLAAAFAAAGKALSAMPFLPLEELEAAIAHHRAAITAATEAEEWQDFPVEHLWMFRAAGSDSRGASW